jgi:hypothetical protein
LRATSASGRHARQRRLHGADPQAAGERSLVAQRGRDVVVERQHLGGPRHDDPARFREHRQAPRAIEQGRAEFLLQGLHLQAHGRLREADRLAGAGEGAVAGDGLQRAEGAERHASDDKLSSIS